MDLFENFVLHWGVFMCRWVHGSYRCVIFTLKMKIKMKIKKKQLQNQQYIIRLAVSLFQYLYFNLRLLNSYW